MLPISVLLYLSLQQERLALICQGGGSGSKNVQSSVYAADNNGNSGWATIQGKREVSFDDQVDLWIEGGEGRIRLPRTMLPKIRGGKNGWFKLRNIESTEDEINAIAGVNFMSSPKVHLDRRSGTISIDGRVGHYYGRCAKVNSSSERAF